MAQCYKSHRPAVMDFCMPKMTAFSFKVVKANMAAGAVKNLAMEKVPAVGIPCLTWRVALAASWTPRGPEATA